MLDGLGFDPKTLTDDELYERHLELTGKKVLAARFGRGTVVEQLTRMLNALEHERRERMFNERIGAYIQASSPVVIETDPDLREQQEVVEPTKVQKSTETRPVRRVVRTPRPVAPDKNGAI